MKKNNRPFMILTISGLILTGLAGCTNDTELTGAYGVSAGADTGIVTEQTLAKAEKEDKNTKEDVEATTEDSTEATTEVADKDTSNTTGTSTTGKNNTGTTTGNTNTGTSTGSSHTGTSTGSSNTGTSTGNTNTGSSTGNTSGNSGNTNPPATEAPATEAPATEATTEATVAYYRDWDYICRRTNELLQQNFPGAVIQRCESCQTYTDYDGYPFPLAYSDEAYAQGMYDMIARDLASNNIYPGNSTPVATGVFLEYIEDSNSPKYATQRTIHLTYYK